MAAKWKADHEGKQQKAKMKISAAKCVIMSRKHE